MIAIWIVLGLAISLAAGIGIGRHFESSDRRERDRLLDEADRDIAALHALDRIHQNSTS